jgi:peroxisomal membrane protein 4
MTQYSTILATLADEIQAIIAALVGGARYGVKVRLPHALVMTVLFRRDLTSKQKIESVLKLAFEHGSNLAAFAAIYKVRWQICLLAWAGRIRRFSHWLRTFRL